MIVSIPSLFILEQSVGTVQSTALMTLLTAPIILETAPGSLLDSALLRADWVAVVKAATLLGGLTIAPELTLEY